MPANWPSGVESQPRTWCGTHFQASMSTSRHPFYIHKQSGLDGVFFQRLCHAKPLEARPICSSSKWSHLPSKASLTTQIKNFFNVLQCSSMFFNNVQHVFISLFLRFHLRSGLERSNMSGYATLPATSWNLIPSLPPNSRAANPKKHI